MSEIITIHGIKSIEYTHPDFELGKATFYKDWNGNWFTAKFVCDASPKGWGFTTIQYEFDGKCIQKPVPFCCLYDLEDYLDQQPDYGQYQAAGD